MFNRDKIIKLNDYLWEIPQSFRNDMRVPARIYASEKLLKQTEDGALTQLVNTATLPGIMKYALAMPDIHTGYGFCVGGVAATKYPAGVISPGGIGYDQNCLPSNSKILLENGAYLSIKKLNQIWKEEKIINVDFQTQGVNSSQIIQFFKRYNNPTIYRIISSSGEKIEATGDHPVQTQKRMKKIKDLKGDEHLLVYPFKGVNFEKPSSKIILTEKRFKEYLKSFNKTNKGNASSQIFNQIKSRGLLPLRYNSLSLPYILKIIGYIFGDGVVSFINNKKGMVQFYGNSEDLKEIQKDILKIGFKPPKIYSRKRNHSINTFYRNYKFSSTEHSIKIGSSALAIFLVALGTPYSRKSHKEYGIPKWIFNCPLWQKRLFLAPFFGAELSTPSTLNKYNFYAPQLSMQKAKGLERSAKLFLKDITKLLKGFGVETYSIIKEVPGYQYEGKQGKTVGFRLQIKERAENLIRFFETINYEYNQNKHKEACLAANYLKRKLKVVNLRAKIREKIQNLYQKKGDFKKIIQNYNNQYTPVQFLYHSLFEENSWGVRKKRGSPRIAFDFPSFKEYKNQYAYGNQGLVWNKIEKIKKIPYADFVYDFTVNHPDHNFIANNFVVSNCGVRLLKSDYEEGEIKPYLEKLTTEIQKEIPSGLGKGRQIKLSIEQINRILEGGAKYLVEKGYGEKEDVENCESQGHLETADASFVSDLAKKRGRDQVGTLGSGNHFTEIQKVAEIFDEETAKVFGLFKDQVVVMVHTGSRGLGHQNCTDYLKIVMEAISKYGIKLPDRELACVPFNSPEGQKFFKAMSAACNFAWSNRQMITYYLRQAWQKTLLNKTKLSLLYDVAHNIAKIEEHQIEGKTMKLIVHRKGATRAFPPGHPEIPEKYHSVGQPVLIPGTMGTASYILAGNEKSKEAFFSVCHGAGRAMSRHAAIKKFDPSELIKQLEQKGIIVKCQSPKGLVEEAPQAYKNIDEVIETVEKAGLSRKVAKLVPLAVIKGE